MSVRMSPPRRRLVPCACKRADDGLVFRDELREATPTGEATCLGSPCDPARRRAAGPMRDPITLLQGPQYERLLLCLLTHCPLRAGSEVTKTFIIPSVHLEFVCIPSLFDHSAV